MRHCLLYAAVCAGIAASVLATSPVTGADWSGELEAEARWFLHDPLDPVQQESGVSIRFEPEFWHDWDDGSQRLVISPFVRADSADSERSHADLREFYWRKSFASAELSVGLRKVYWGVAESQHLVDIINQTDFVENIDTEDKLGQPMVHLSLLKDWGTVEFFVMPWFRERTFAGRDGRLRPPLAVATSDPLYESGAEERHVDLAVRWSHYIGDYDIGLAHFSGTARDPQLIASFDPTTGPVLQPRYNQLEQTSVDLQATKGSWLWKLEAVGRKELGQRSAALVGGFEYTLVGIFESAVDLGLVCEYAFDDRGKTVANADNDLALGFRLALNDVQSSELLAFTGTDLDNQSRFTSIEGSRRIGQSYRLSVEARFFSNASPGDLLYSVRDDDYLELAFSRFF